MHSSKREKILRPLKKCRKLFGCNHPSTNEAPLYLRPATDVVSDKKTNSSPRALEICYFLAFARLNLFAMQVKLLPSP